MCDVLILDDDDLVLSVIADALRDDGLDVVEARSPAEALEWFRRDKKPDVLVTDVNLGQRLDGRDVARGAREALPGLPVIFITGRPDRFWGTVLDAHQLLLPKPFHASELVNAVRKMRLGDARQN